LQNSVIVKAVYINWFDILPKLYLPNQVSAHISGIWPSPDIWYPALARYLDLTGYPANQISDQLDIQPTGYLTNRISDQPDI
jgi:hypothetical protein